MCVCVYLHIYINNISILTCVSDSLNTLSYEYFLALPRPPSSNNRDFDDTTSIQRSLFSNEGRTRTAT